MVGVVGALQFDVLADRIRSRVRPARHFEATSFEVAAGSARTIRSSSSSFADANHDNIAEDQLRRHGVPGAQR